ncbi:MAG TPA: CPBP family intramembrane glutamic endopeptidase [Anaerolineaceae bacterium]
MSSRIQRPQIGFKYARRDGIIALSLYLLILVFSFLFYAFNAPVYPQPLHLAAAPVNDLGQALTLALLSLAVFAAAMVIRRQPIRSIGWNPATLRPALLAGFALAVITIFLRNRFMYILGGQAGDKLIPLLLALGIAMAEETIFRGYLQLRLVWWLGPVPGILLTSALSTLWHVPAWLGRLPVETTLILTGLTFLQALVLGWAMRKTGHVLVPGFYRAISIWVQFLG